MIYKILLFLFVSFNCLAQLTPGIIPVAIPAVPPASSSLSNGPLAVINGTNLITAGDLLPISLHIGTTNILDAIIALQNAPPNGGGNVFSQGTFNPGELLLSLDTTGTNSRPSGLITNGNGGINMNQANIGLLVISNALTNLTFVGGSISGMTNSDLTASKLVFSDANKRLSSVNVGIGLTNNSGTLSNNIVAGANVTITGGANGQLSIASTASGGGGTATNIYATNIINLANYIYPSQFGMKGDGVFITNIFITNGAAVLNCTNGWGPNTIGYFTNTDVGKTIHIYKAGPHGVAEYDMIATITSVTATNLITVNFNAQTTVTGGVGAGACYGTDDTAGLQAAINYGLLTNGNYTCLLLEPRIYMFSGPFDATKNAQVYTPDLPYSSTAAVYNPTFEIKGNSSGSGFSFTSGGQQAPIGPTLYSCISNTIVGKSFLRAVQGSASITFSRFMLTDLAIRVPTNPRYTAVDFQFSEAAQIKNCIVWDGWIAGSTPVVPALSTSYGIKMPGGNNNGGGWNRIEDVRILGFYNGFQAGEHTYGNNVTMIDCFIGVDFPTVAHGSSFGRLEFQQVNYCMSFSGKHLTTVQCVDVEHDGGIWTRVLDVLDGSGLGYGDISFGTVTGGVGMDNSFIWSPTATNLNFNGLSGTNFVQRNMVATNITNVISGTIYGLNTNITKVANYTLLTGDSGKHINNNGAAGAVILTAPAASIGLQYDMDILANQTFEFLAVGTDTIRNIGTVGGAAGNIQTNTIGNSVHIYCPVAGQWFTKETGVWIIN